MCQPQSGVKCFIWNISFFYPVIRNVGHLSYRGNDSIRRVEMPAGSEPVLRGTVFFFMAVQLHWQICCWLLRWVVLLALVVQETLGCHVRLLLKFLALLGSLLTSNKSLKLHGSFYIWRALVRTPIVYIFKTGKKIPRCLSWNEHTLTLPSLYRSVTNTGVLISP